jgi:hypothetical protein
MQVLNGRVPVGVTSLEMLRVEDQVRRFQGDEFDISCEKEERKDRAGSACPDCTPQGLPENRHSDSVFGR